MELGLADRVSIVTGASGAVGRATAALLVAEGAHVLLVGRDAGKLERVAGELTGPGEARPLPLDVTDPDAGTRLVAECVAAFGRLDIVVNNAGTSAVRPIDVLTDAEWQDQWELHVMAPMRLMRAAAPHMAERGWGRIVNVSSSSGKRPSGTNMAYSVTKAAVLSLSRAFADLYAAKGVRVNAVTPGPILSELWLDPGGLADQQAAAKGTTREEILAATAARTPVGRLASPQEIADVIAFLCSERASNVAGAAWSVDGGTVPVIL